MQVEMNLGQKYLGHHRRQRDSMGRREIHRRLTAGPGIRGPEIISARHSVLNASIGFSAAARMTLAPTVRKATARASAPPAMNTQNGTVVW